MPVCPECGEGLGSHAGRNHKYFHQHVLSGPYPNPEPHPKGCSLVNCAFDVVAVPIKGSAEARAALVDAIHGHKNKGAKIAD